MNPNNTTSQNYFAEFTLGSKWACVSLVIVVILLTLLGNIVSIFVFVTCRSLRERTTTQFIVNLCSSDILVSVACMPFWCSVLLVNWPTLNSNLYRFWLTMDTFCSVVSIACLTVISIERYFSVQHPLDFHRLLTRRRIRLATCGVWFYGLSASLPGFFYGPTLGYSWFIFTLAYLLPVSIMVFCYSSMFNEARKQAVNIARLEVRGMVLQQERRQSAINSGPVGTRFDSVETDALRPTERGCREKKRNGSEEEARLNKTTKKKYIKNGGSYDSHSLSSNSDEDNRPVDTEATRKLLFRTRRLVHELKAAKVVGLVVGSFIICWTPFIMAILLYNCGVRFTMIYLISAKLLHYCNSALNPLLYFTFNKMFREALKRRIKVLCTK